MFDKSFALALRTFTYARTTHVKNKNMYALHTDIILKETYLQPRNYYMYALP